MVNRLLGSAVVGVLLLVGISYMGVGEHSHEGDSGDHHGDHHEVKRSPGPTLLDHHSHGDHTGVSKKGHSGHETKEGLKRMHEDHTGGSGDTHHGHDHGEEGREGHSH